VIDHLFGWMIPSNDSKKEAESAKAASRTSETKAFQSNFRNEQKK